MLYLQAFESYLPESDHVEKILKYIKKEYSIETTKILDKETKYVMVNGKMVFINNNKSNLKNKLYIDIKDNFKDYSESSIKKAIKEFIK